jgi:tol-pal system protein YbgF
MSTGCVTQPMFMKIQSDVDSLRASVATLHSKLDEEQKSQGEILRLIRADQQLRFSEIDRKVSEIGANLNENQFRLSKIDEQTAEFQKKLSAKLTADSIASDSRNAEIEKLFQIAMSDFNAGRYDIATNGFKDLIVQYPGSPVASDAEYWLAECYYAKRAYAEAEKNYISYVKKYPDGSKLCVSLYKLGLAYEKQRKNKSKRMVWQKAINQCPDSPEIKVIKAQMR